jgi:PAS domain S-box-containing protein
MTFRELFSRIRYHMLFTSIDEAFALCKIVVDDNGEPTDYLLLDVNPAFEEMTGITPEAAEGKTARELVAGIEEWWIETYGKVALGGETIRFENRVEEMDRWFDAYAAPVGEGDEELFALVFKDITGRRREEEERGRMRSRETAERERISRELHDRVHTRWASPTRASSSKGPWPKAPPSAPGRRSQSPRRPRKAP